MGQKIGFDSKIGLPSAGEPRSEDLLVFGDPLPY
jgi:hypothetical protein